MNMKKLFRSQSFSPHSRPLSEGKRETPLPVGEQGRHVFIKRNSPAGVGWVKIFEAVVNHSVDKINFIKLMYFMYSDSLDIIHVTPQIRG